MVSFQPRSKGSRRHYRAVPAHPVDQLPVDQVDVDGMGVNPVMSNLPDLGLTPLEVLGGGIDIMEADPGRIGRDRRPIGDLSSQRGIHPSIIIKKLNYGLWHHRHGGR